MRKLLSGGVKMDTLQSFEGIIEGVLDFQGPHECGDKDSASRKTFCFDGIIYNGITQHPERIFEALQHLDRFFRRLASRLNLWLFLGRKCQRNKKEKGSKQFDFERHRCEWRQ